MIRPARLLRSLPYAIMAFAMILSAAAWGAHSVTHGLGFASLGAAHHDAHAAPATHDDGMPGQDKQDGGHDHLQGLSFPLAALFDGTSLAPPPFPPPPGPPPPPPRAAPPPRPPPPPPPAPPPGAGCPRRPRRAGARHK